ncbi:MAG TPA: SDR family oxidoreductase [Luteolibacter sp.]|nr:SDR family oxidoreductase [Luteolibacter sp.]
MPTPRHCALITGASSGLGEEFARQLAPCVDQLVLVARRGDLLEDLATSIAADHPELDIRVLVVDLAEAAQRVRLLEALAEARLAPDLLINNAGLGDYGDFATAQWPRIEAMLKVNVEALTHLSHGLLPGMIEQGEGAVINVSSLASLLPIPDFAVYAATKAYVTSFSEALRIELREHGIPVLALCPGPVHTGFGKVAQRGEGEKGIPGREWFYVDKEQVVAEALEALERGQARVFPHWKTAAAALFISAVPIILLRALLSSRPRK